MTEELVPKSPTSILTIVPGRNVTGSETFQRLKYDPQFIHQLIIHGADNIGYDGESRNALKCLYAMYHPLVDKYDSNAIQSEIEFEQLNVLNTWKLVGNRKHVFTNISGDAIQPVISTEETMRTWATKCEVDHTLQVVQKYKIDTLPWTLHMLVNFIGQREVNDTILIGPTAENKSYGAYKVIAKENGVVHMNRIQ
jgi:hypothetical protein